MEKSKIIKKLDLLLSDFDDLENQVYWLGKEKLLTDGISYTIDNLILSPKKNTFVPLNLIKPFFKMFFHSPQAYYRAKYKKRPVLTSFRGELDKIPLYLNDQIIFTIYQSDQVIWQKSGLVCDFLENHSLKIDPTNANLSFNLKLIDGSSRGDLELAMDSSKFLDELIIKEIRLMNQFHQQSKLRVEQYLQQELKLPNLKITDLNLSHLKQLSNDVLILQKIITHLKYDRLAHNLTSEIRQYRQQLQEIIEVLNKSSIKFDSPQVILNFIV